MELLVLYYDSKAYAFYSLLIQKKYDGDTTSKEKRLNTHLK